MQWHFHYFIISNQQFKLNLLQQEQSLTPTLSIYSKWLASVGGEGKSGVRKKRQDQFETAAAEPLAIPICISQVMEVVQKQQVLIAGCILQYKLHALSIVLLVHKMCLLFCKFILDTDTK